MGWQGDSLNRDFLCVSGFWWLSSSMTLEPPSHISTQIIHPVKQRQCGLQNRNRIQVYQTLTKGIGPSDGYLMCIKHCKIIIKNYNIPISWSLMVKCYNFTRKYIHAEMLCCCLPS